MFAQRCGKSKSHRCFDKHIHLCFPSYTEHYVTEGEFQALPPRLQEQVKRTAAHNSQSGWNMYYSPAVTPNRYRRVGEFQQFFSDTITRKELFSDRQSFTIFTRLMSPSHRYFGPTDWLSERTYFEGLVRRDSYAVGRLGYKAPNIFIMQLVS